MVMRTSGRLLIPFSVARFRLEFCSCAASQPSWWSWYLWGRDWAWSMRLFDLQRAIHMEPGLRPAVCGRFWQTYPSGGVVAVSERSNRPRASRWLAGPACGSPRCRPPPGRSRRT